MSEGKDAYGFAGWLRDCVVQSAGTVVQSKRMYRLTRKALRGLDLPDARLALSKK